MSMADELERLARLREQGVLSEAEFASAKEKILGGQAAPPAGGPFTGADPINRFRLSQTDKWLGGVCGGLGKVTGIDSWVWRVVFLVGLFFGGLTFFIYIILWICVPREGT